MPELPEVETIRRTLLCSVSGLRVRHCQTREARVFRSSRHRVEQSLCGQRIGQVLRRGKYLYFELDDYFLVCHLGMTGQLTVRDPETADSERFIRHETTGLERIRQHAPDKHTHLQIFFSDGKALLYRDPRKFGRIYLFDILSGELKALFGKLGMEPLGPDYQIERFLSGMKKKKAPVKAVLLDQRFVAGIGNIYADEALFHAGVHPGRRVPYLRKRDRMALFEAIPKVLEKGIDFGGTTLRDFIDSDGKTGRFQEQLAVYGRQGQPCIRCGDSIRRIVIAQRGTHFCPRCQKR